jgi:predicted Zn-dependent protease
MAARVTVPMFRGDYAGAAARARELLDIEPSCGFVTGYLAEALNAMGQYAETVELAAPGPGQPQTAAVTTAYARALALSGDRERAVTVRDAFAGPAVMQAAIELALDAPERALDLLELGITEDNGLLAVVDLDPVFEPLRGEKRYASILSTYRAAARG